MKVSELIAVLERELAEHGDVEAKYTWESIYHETDESVYFEGGVLYLDADSLSYKGPTACTHSSPPASHRNRSYHRPVVEGEKEAQ